MDLAEIYRYGSQFAYAGAILAVLTASAFHFGRDPSLLRHYTTPLGRWVFVPLIGLAVLGALAFGAAWIAGQLSSGPILLNLTLMGLIILGGSLVVFPMAADLEPDAQRAPWDSRRRAWLAALSVLTVGWSVGVFWILSKLVEVEAADQSFASQISPGRPLEFTGFAAFALMAAVGEEVLFRGGIQGWLRPRTGAVPAVLIAAALFALGHGGYVTVIGVKELQILGVGILFGIAREKCGLGGAIVVHLANNAFSLAAACVEWAWTTPV